MFYVGNLYICFLWPSCIATLNHDCYLYSIVLIIDTMLFSYVSIMYKYHIIKWFGTIDEYLTFFEIIICIWGVFPWRSICPSGSFLLSLMYNYVKQCIEY